VTVVLSLAAQILHIALMIAAAPILAGTADWLDARLSGRTGPPLLSPWRDLVRLSRKTITTTENALLVPSFTIGMALSPLADMLVIVSLLASARVAGALATFDSGPPQSGMVQQNASALATLAEPALMLAMVALALMGGSFNLDLIISQQREGLLLPAAASAVTLTALLALLLADLSAAVGDINQACSGLDLAMIRVAAWLRRLVWIDLIGALFLPIGLATADSGAAGWLIGVAAWAIKLAAATLALSAFQAILGRIPRQSLPDLIGVAALLALLAVIMVLASTGLA
jgi:formate hydrogenlyase subunit 4